ncbi:MAG: dihydrolipoamide acetyltransferase component of pyruvate dehydrogenase complex [Fimbriimonadales bacterium]|nr:MAG: dihydrolipoamide acetyltransferase component of pyruvate dehydrogenase complex [Fimbriimonadales bacterium]
MAIVEIIVPQLGEGLQEVRVMRFLKQPGDRVERDEHIYEMETDKANVEVESPYAGVIVEWLAKEGEILPIGAPIARMEVEGTVEAAAPVHGHAPQPASAPTPVAERAPAVPVGARLEVVIPPRTRAYARQKGISEEELRRIPAAAGNKLMPEDIDVYLTGRSTGSAEYVDYPLPQQQRTFIYRIKRSSQLVVPAVLRRYARWNSVQRVVEQFKNNPSAPVHPSEFQVFAYCAAQATLQHPKFRSQLVGEDTLRQYEHVNLGIAVARPGDELVTALVKNASALEFVNFVKTLQSQIRKARAGEDQADASIQLLLTYMGGYQMVDAIPVLVSPAVAILFAGEAFLVDGAPHVNLVLTFDHRLINGVGGAEFLNAVAHNIENAETLVQAGGSG